MQTEIKLANLSESKTNPRSKEFHKDASFEELVSSIKEKGVLMPILVRLVGIKKSASVGRSTDDNGTYEVIAGNRRARAAKVAGLETIPAKVVEMTDNEAREAQIVENLQRQDISPLEEGQAYRELIEQSKQTVQDISIKVGKSVTYVRDRLVLTNLIPAGVKAYGKGELSASHASLIARLENKKQQEEALKYVLEEWNDVSISDLKTWIKERIYTDLSNTPWANDEALREAVGNCEECPSGKVDLFGKSAEERCPNPKCYARKMAAFIEIKLREEPTLVKLSSNYGQPETKDVIGQREYHEIDSKKDGCKNESRGIVVEGNGLGRIIRICKDPVCEKHRGTVSDYSLTPEQKKKKKDEAKKEREKAEKLKKKENDDFASALKKVKWPLSEKHLDILLDLVFARFGYSYLAPVASRHGIKSIKTKNKYDYVSRDLVGPMKKWILEGGNKRKIETIFEVAIEATNSKELIKKL